VYYPTLYQVPKPADFATYVRTLQSNLRERGRMAATRAAMGRQAQCYSRVAELRWPVRIVMGTKDPDFPDPAVYAEYARQLFGAHTETTVAMIEGAGHYPHAELPGDTASAVLPFLADVVHA
jgi:pimeloyl-ACP methyl ester carboxylesterase